ncbi:MAG: LytTR family transcriptional regulator DNA-binding domain-containing protein [Tannerella sp.]|nr:LytTR family transcriptional regulator DNA-binding domain-containing protein [Tannerella sp.]
MNAIETKTIIYVSACLTIAGGYAFAVDGLTGQGLAVSAVEAGVYAVMLGLAGVALPNMFRFAVPVNYSQTGRNAFIAVLMIAATIFVVGIVEIIVFLVCNRFVISALPAKIFITSLIIIIIRLVYLIDKSKNCKDVETLPATSLRERDLTLNSQLSTLNFTVRSGRNIRIIPVEEILYIKADGDYVSICTKDGSWLKDMTMNAIEAMLSPADFVRVHRSFIVNIHSISRIERWGEQQLIILNSGIKIKISAARYHTLKKVLGL